MSIGDQLPDGGDQVGLDDPKVEILTLDRYKGRLNQTDRLALLSVSLLRVRTHYHEKFAAGKKTGKTFRCLSTPEKQGVCCQHIGEPDQKFGMVLFQYLTDANGKLLTDEKLAGKLKIWIVSETRYSELSNIHREFPLMATAFGQPQFDLQVKCTEEAFQRMQFTPCREAFWKKKQSWFDALHAKEIKARAKLSKVIAAEMTEAEILSFLEIDTPNPVSPAKGVSPHSTAMAAAGMAEFDVDDVLG